MSWRRAMLAVCAAAPSLACATLERQEIHPWLKISVVVAILAGAILAILGGIWFLVKRRRA